MKFEFSRQIFEKISNIKFQKKLLNPSRYLPSWNRECGGYRHAPNRFKTEKGTRYALYNSLSRSRNFFLNVPGKSCPCWDWNSGQISP